MTSAEGVLATTFKTTKFRGSGYDIGEVDEFLQRIATTLSVLEGSRPAAGPLLSAKDVLAQQFATVKRRESYVVEEVDQLLDDVAATLNGYARKAAESTGTIPVVRPNARPAGRTSAGRTSGHAAGPRSEDAIPTAAATARAQDVAAALSGLPEGAALGLRVLTQQLQIATVRTDGADALIVRTPDGGALRIVAVDASPTGVVLHTARS
jgi:DivIVA domain-containing protein